MLEILKGIDLFLQSRLARWALLISFCISIVCLLWVDLLNQKFKVEAAILLSQKATLEAQVDVQNEAVKRAAEDYNSMTKQIEDANIKVQSMKKQLDNRKVEIRQIVLNGTCDEKVQQVVKEVLR